MTRPSTTLRRDAIHSGRVSNAEEDVYPNQIAAKLRQIEVLIRQGRTVPLACKESGIVDQNFYRWRKEYGGLQIEQVKKLKDLQKGERATAARRGRFEVEKQILKDIAEGDF